MRSAARGSRRDSSIATPTSSSAARAPTSMRCAAPGLIDCPPRLAVGGTRADAHAMRRAGATYEEIAKAGGGIAATVAKTRAASDEELLDQSRHRLRALMRGGCTTVEIKTGYGLD